MLRAFLQLLHLECHCTRSSYPAKQTMLPFLDNGFDKTLLNEMTEDVKSFMGKNTLLVHFLSINCKCQADAHGKILTQTPKSKLSVTLQEAAHLNPSSFSNPEPQVACWQPYTYMQK